MLKVTTGDFTGALQFPDGFWFPKAGAQRFEETNREIRISNLMQDSQGLP